MSRSFSLSVSFISIVSVAALLACGQPGYVGTPLAANQSALRAASGVTTQADVTDIRYTISVCGSSGELVEVERPLEERTIPGNLGELHNQPLDENSQHLFADFFQTLDAGCYDVKVEPLQEDGSASDVCESAWKDDVDVEEGQTTEVLLLIQCEGRDLGAADVIAAINHEPEFLGIEFDDSKFSCGESGNVCMQARDVDGDPLEFVLEAESGCEVDGPQLDGDDPAEGIEACFKITCDDPGRADLQALVFDQVWVDGSKERIEDWLESEGYPSPSHSSLEFWAYFDGFDVYADEDSDGFGDEDETILACSEDDIPDGWVSNDDDCNDENSDIHPDAEEICGDDIDQNCDGVDEECEAEPFNVGNDEKFDAPVQLPQGALYAVQLSVDSEVRLKSLSIIPRFSGPQFQLALYEDDRGVPGDLVAGTGTDTLTGGVANTLDTNDEVLSPGNYWMAGVFSSTVYVYAGGNPEETFVRGYPHTFGDPLPAVFPYGDEFPYYFINFYMTVEPN